MGKYALRDRPDGVAGRDPVTDPDRRGEIPAAVRDRIQVNTSLQEEATLFGQIGQRVLKAVVDLRQQTGAELNAHQLTGEFHRVADLDALRHLVDLHAGLAVRDTDDFAL